MAERWVVNASPLILLAKVGRESLLADQAEQLVVPLAVAAEIGAGPPDDPARRILASGRFSLAEAPPLPPDLVAWDLGPGETEVIACALALGNWTAIIDDAAARRCAAAFGVPVKGTLAVVILAKRHGLILSAAEVLRDLRLAGFYLDDSLVSRVLKNTVGEVWMP